MNPMAEYIMTSQTCGEACWHAREEVCCCSCGGKNHGCLSNGGERPERTSKISGHTYLLQAVGKRRDISKEAARINREAGFSSVDKPIYVVEAHGNQTKADWDLAKAQGKDTWVAQYCGIWRETDNGAPARIKYPTSNQLNWSELAGWKDDRETALLWVRVTMPERPVQLKVDKNGVTLENQNPQ